MLDNKVISAPQIREPITGGQGNISGNFSPETANDLAVLLRAGYPSDISFMRKEQWDQVLGIDSISWKKSISY